MTLCQVKRSTVFAQCRCVEKLNPTLIKKNLLFTLHLRLALNSNEFENLSPHIFKDRNHVIVLTVTRHISEAQMRK